MGDASSQPKHEPKTTKSNESLSPTYPHWHDVIAGAAAGLGGRAITAPLDLLKIRRQLAPSTTQNATTCTISNTTTKTAVIEEWKIFQHLHSIAKKEGGIRSLFRGNVAASYLWMGYSCVQFSVYGRCSEYLNQQYNMHNNNGNNMKIASMISFTSGAISGLCATIITYPFDLCRTIFAARGILPIAASNVTWSNHTTELAAKSIREQHQYADQHVWRRPPKTVSEFSRHMYKQNGLKGFYAGSLPGLLQIAPYMGINFALHDLLIVASGGSGDSRVSGIAGMGAGIISKFLVYPLDTVKKRLQAQAFWGSSSNGSAIANQGNYSTKYSTALPKNPSMYSNRRRVIGAVNRSFGNKKLTHNTANAVVHYDGMLDCFKQIAKREGMAAFYKGLVPSLLKSSVSTGASFWLFTLTKNVLRSIHDSDRF